MKLPKKVRSLASIVALASAPFLSGCYFESQGVETGIRKPAEHPSEMGGKIYSVFGKPLEKPGQMRFNSDELRPWRLDLRDGYLSDKEFLTMADFYFGTNASKIAGRCPYFMPREGQYETGKVRRNRDGYEVRFHWDFWDDEHYSFRANEDLTEGVLEKYEPFPAFPKDLF